jgi:predicted ATPase
VARKVELARQHALLDEVASGGQDRLVLLAGEPGIGKTRLAPEVMQVALASDFLVATGRCDEPQVVVAHYPFLEVLSHAYAVARGGAASAARSGCRVPVAAAGSGTAGSGTAGSGTAGSGTAGSGRGAQQRLFWHVTGFIQALAAERPVALLLDDLHWADGASPDLMQYLAQHTRDAPTCFWAPIATSRSTGSIP